MHEYRNEEWTRFKHFARCTTAKASGITCSPAQQEDVHILQEDELNKLCPEYKKKTPPETPP